MEFCPFPQGTRKRRGGDAGFRCWEIRRGSYVQESELRFMPRAGGRVVRRMSQSDRSKGCGQSFGTGSVGC